MKRYMKTMNKFNKTQGSILQLVLIIFLVLVLNIGVFFSGIINNSKAINRVKEINESRLIELTILRYYKEMILNEVLISDIINIQNYVIEYTVDDLGNFYYILTTVRKKEQEYSFNLKINIETLVISSFEYQ
ncbi:hypothetical protein [Thomasclavelia cocleata]|jgi:hypothetical protein|uniref:Type II secretory pathway, pseudopilin PulG n=4 Tax=Thomasclavelia cocleata TaxID=69824 RepID=A0A1I0BDM8_9FIRM|nr:hypothetical protein [Thomasclavelia cocleata]GFI41838.1 hypothetical protein IMSAGC017_01883 [Thomasclavelia cocleata]SET04607.1 hypothetical protein SAMN04489758_10164 [Thomasclavelia cocleata]